VINSGSPSGEIVDTSVLYDLVTLVGIAGLIGSVIFCALLAHELTGRMTAPMTNRRSPEPALTQSGQRRRTVSWLWTSPLPGATAVLTVIVTTPLTAPIIEWLTEGKLWFGLVSAVCALMGAAVSVLLLMRRSNGGADVARRGRTGILAAVAWLVALVLTVPVLPMLIDAGGRSITDITVMAVLLVPCPAWILLQRGNRWLHRNGARPGAVPLPTQQH
jgi:hypothetical protein